MVSMNPTSPEGFYLDADGVALPGINSFSPSPANSAADAAAHTSGTSADDLNSKKVRKPYTISKSRESWTEPEHDKFLEALQLFDRDWKKIEAFIGSKTVIQIRSHAQKYFLKVQKSGSNEHLPPPRPKRKAAHPYPQKAPKSATSVSQASGSLPASEPVIQRPEPTIVPRVCNNTAVMSSWVPNSQTAGLPNETQGDTKFTKPTIVNNSSSSTESTAMARTGKLNEALKHGPPLRVLPDFAQVYSFIGSVFDPEASGHLQRLKKMDPIDVETALLLMRNLSINLTSPDFEDHRRLLSSCDIDSDKAISGGMNNIVCGD